MSAHTPLEKALYQASGDVLMSPAVRSAMIHAQADAAIDHITAQIETGWPNDSTAHQIVRVLRGGVA